jgi:site-specific DNA-methyltransferase (adenine-specific)
MELIKEIPDNSIDAIITDPPYLYLNQKFDRPFDESLFFSAAKRVLKKDGFIVLFGRGTSFYRWNTILSNMGFTFKEEIVWNKRRNSIPALQLQRVHETVSIHTIGKGKVNPAMVRYEEQKQFDFASIAQDIQRIKSALNSEELNALLLYVQEKKIRYSKTKHKTFFPNGMTDRSRACATYRTITGGMREKSIIELRSEHYSRIHPTQKPVRLFERLMALVTQEGDIVLDPFSGSASVAIAAYNTNRQFIGFEIDTEYYEKSVQRLLELKHGKKSI